MFLKLLFFFKCREKKMYKYFQMKRNVIFFYYPHAFDYLLWDVSTWCLEYEKKIRLTCKIKFVYVKKLWIAYLWKTHFYSCFPRDTFTYDQNTTFEKKNMRGLVH